MPASLPGSGLMPPHDQPRRFSLTRAQRRELDRRIADRLLALGLNPFRRSSGLDYRSADDRALSRSLLPRWLFPSTGLLRAAEQTHAFVAAAANRDRSDLRLVTLRAGSQKPTASGFVDNIDVLSSGINTFVDHLSREGRATPLLSAIHLRIDTSSGQTLIDPHLHGIWQISSSNLQEVRRYLEPRFADVWIDDEPLRTLRGSAFYVCSGVIDYTAVLDWPDEVIRAVWKMPRRRMIRRAGWAAGPRQASKQPTAEPSTSAGKPRKQPIQADPDAAGEKAPRRGGTAAKAGIGSTGRSSRPRTGAVSSTVRRLKPGRPGINDPSPTSPTLDQIYLTLVCLRHVLDGGGLITARRASKYFEIKEQLLLDTVACVESFLQTSLFHPGPQNELTPTEAAREFARKGTLIMRTFERLTLRLQSSAEASRHDLRYRWMKGPFELHLTDPTVSAVSSTATGRANGPSLAGGTPRSD